NINILFSVSSVANAIWILTWHYEKMLLATILIIVILICLILINLRIERSKLSLKEKMFIYLPFNVYFGWLTVATIANITTFLVSTGWGGFGISEDIWTSIILIIGFLISGLVIMRQRNIAYGLVILWSYIGIYVKHISKDGWNSEFPLVTTTVTVLIVLIIITMLYTLFVIKKKAKKETVVN
ncbi:MAG: tryptophan-rich sensory protein, partial [Tissierellia bacterium]|nr:tryptophan-rich sensory protein [Tissierellia bacterium]